MQTVKRVIGVGPGVHCKQNADSHESDRSKSWYTLQTECTVKRVIGVCPGVYCKQNADMIGVGPGIHCKQNVDSNESKPKLCCVRTPLC